MSETPTKVKICGITNLADAELAVELGAWAIGMIFYEGSPRSCSLEQAQQITAALRRKVELCGVFVNASAGAGRQDERGSGADDGAAARRRGPGVLRRGAAQDRRAGDQGGAGVRARATCATWSATTSTSICSTRARRRSEKQELRGGTGETFDWALLDGRRSKVPLILSGGLNAENVARGDRDDGAVRGGQRQRHGERSGEEGRAEAAGVLRGASQSTTPAGRAVARGRARRERSVEHRFGQYGGQFVPETLMPALAELEQAWLAGARGPGLPRGAERPAARLRRAPDAAVPRQEAVRASRAGRSISSARISTTPARTSSTTRSGRRCWPGGWASAGSSPRPAPASTAWRPRRCARCWGWSASSTWAPRTRAGSGRTCSGWSCWGRRVQAGRRGREDAEGGHLGGDPRLGDERGEHPLRDRLGRRPGAVSGARARPAARDRRRGAGADAGARGAAAGAGDRLRGRGLERDRHVRGVPGRRAGAADRRRGRRRGDRHARGTARR